MAEKEVTIKISAKNLTEAEFKKARAGLRGLGSASDAAKQKTTGLQRAFSSFGKAAPGALRIVTKAAAAAGVAITGLAVAVVKLGERGAVVADVKSAFVTLSTAAGETGAVMLGALQAGVKSTVTNFKLMQLANMALGAGILKTATDARTLAEGARLLAKRTGGDTAQAFQTLTTAIASGRTAQLKQLGLFVDNKKAVEDYAKAQGINVSSMNDADRATALQVATMAALRVELINNAPPLADFGELIEQGKVAVKNLVDGLAVMISKSPPLLAGMHAIREVIGKAFGGDQQNLVLGIVNLIERATLIAIEFGLAGISAARSIYEGFSGIKVMVFGIGIAFSELSKTVLNFVASTFEAAASIPVLGAAWTVQAELARGAADAVTGLNEGLKLQIEDAAIAAAGNDAWGLSLDATSTALGVVKEAMVNAGLSQKELSVVTDEGTIKNQENAVSLDGVISYLKEQREALKKTAVEAAFFGKGVHDLSVLFAAETAQMKAAFASFGIATRAEQDATVKKLEKDFKIIEESGKATAKDLEKAWVKVEEARRQMSGETVKELMTNEAAMFQGSMQILGALGEKYKAAAIASAIISTYQAIAKALASAVWPFSLILAAGAAAAGFANVAKIRASSSNREGTPGLDFQEFGTSSMATLHGREAVIPQGGGHRLAEEIAGALARTGRPSRDTDALGERFERIGSKLDGLPRAIQRAVRDGMLLAT